MATKLKDFKNEIKPLDIAALLLKAKAINVEIGDLIMDKNMNKLKDLKSISKKKKDLARVMTVLNQKKAIAKLEPVVAKEPKEVKKAEDKQSLRADDLKEETKEKKGGTK